MSHLFDIGANLAHESFEEDLDEVIDDAADAGVARIMITGSDIASTKRAATLAAEEMACGQPVVCTLIMLRSSINQRSINLSVLAKDASVRAWGEMGLDYFRDFTPRDVQRSAFEAQLELAAESDKPLFLHERDAFDDFYPILARAKDRFSKVVVHCFTGNEQALRAYVDLDCYIGITGWVCDERRGQHLLPLLGLIPDDRLLIETDAPYLLPRSLKPKPKSRRCEPKHLVEVCRFMSSVLDIPAEIRCRSNLHKRQSFFRPQLMLTLYSTEGCHLCELAFHLLTQDVRVQRHKSM